MNREVLDRPFGDDQIRHRPGRNGDDVVYVESRAVINRLNEAFEHAWSFTIERHEVHEDEVVVLGRLTAGTVNKSAFGSSSITRTRDGGKAVSIGDDLKAAATDALKKSATLLGIGLTLHAGGADANSSSSRPTAPARAARNDLLSTAQLRAIHAIRKRIGMTDAQLADMAKEIAGTADVEQLDKRAASALIERLQLEAAPAGAQR